MPPFLVALVVAAVGALAYRGNRRVQGAPTVVETTPANNPPGITTGFAAPPLQSTVPPTSYNPPPIETNQPAASSSGVPNWTSNAQEFNTAPYMAAPAPSNRIPGFYNGPIASNLMPRFSPVRPPKIGKQSCSGGGCGCGSGGCQNPSDCSVASARNQDGGCLAPTERSLVASAPPNVMANWIANLASSGVNPFQAAQQMQFDEMDVNPQGEDITPPAAPWIQSIGINRQRPIRSAVFG
jgi:hypothetical protein